MIVEAEIDPAHNAEAEAKSRLGLEVVEGRRTVEAVIALRYPEAVADADDLAAALSGARLSYCVHYLDESDRGPLSPSRAGLRGRCRTLPT